MTEQFQTGLKKPGRGIGRPCKHCRQKFIPKRTDAEFCSNTCSQAASYRRNRQRKEAIAAEIVFKRRQDGLVAIADFRRYQSLAAMLHARARDNDSNAKYMATRIGILRAGSERGSIPDSWREIKTRSDSREIIALLSQEAFVGSYLAREAEKECRALLARGPVDVSIFVEDEEALGSSHHEKEEFDPEDEDKFDTPFWH